VATGFWNPFHLAFDIYGRLFAVDNDPDSLPFCRMVHVVQGGNYGYRYRNGRKGLHPFTAWNGELPGTLPMVAATGEAPCGIVAYESDNLPADYRGDLLATSWGDHRIERFHLEPRGASFRSKAAAIVTGGENFRPVGISVAPDGSLFVSDWVDKSYPVHGKGRIWHVRATRHGEPDRPADVHEAIKSPDRQWRERASRRLAADAQGGRPVLRWLATKSPDPRVRAVALSALAEAADAAEFDRVSHGQPTVDLQALVARLTPQTSGSPIASAADAQPAEVLSEALRRIADPQRSAILWKSLEDADPFIQQAAREALRRLKIVSPQMDFEKLGPAQRLGCLLVLRESACPLGEKALPRFLKDSDPAVRFAAVQWIGEERLADYRPALAEVLSAGATSGQLFAAYLAALERLDGVERESSNEWAGEQYVVQALLDQTSAPDVRRWALRVLRADHPALGMRRLRKFLHDGDAGLRLEAVRTLRDSPHRRRGALLAAIAKDVANPEALRAEAVMGLSAEKAEERAELLALAAGNDRSLRHESLRSLRGAVLNEHERGELARLGQAHADSTELVRRVLEPEARFERPAADDLDAWLKLLGLGDDSAAARSAGGDPAGGERIFFHAKSAGCFRCHQVDGRGGRVGPDLSTRGTADRRKLVDSIVRPSKEIAPQFVSWLVVTTEGKTITGVLLSEDGAGEQVYANEKGETIRFKPSEIERRQQQPTSIMPDGLAQMLTIQEFRDLVAFLLRGRQAEK
jgi:putative heme-binding domain-containing protein